MADEVNPYDVESFLENLTKDRSKTNDGDFNSINKVLMNVRDNQGTLIMIPFLNKFKSFYTKLKGIREWNGPTTLLDQGYAWYKVMPREFYPNLTSDQINLYTEVIGLFDAIREKDVYSYDKIRVRNYSLLYGVAISLTSTDGKENKGIEEKPCLFIYPSHSPIDSLSDSIAQKVVTMKGKKDWIPMILGVSNKGRHGGLVITFKKGQIGYDSSVTFELNSPINMIVDPDKEVLPDEKIALFSDPISDWIGWQNGKEVGNYFNELVFKELRANLQLTLNEIILKETKGKESTELQNQNGNIDPMLNQAAPAVTEDQPKTEDQPTTTNTAPATDATSDGAGTGAIKKDPPF